MSCGATVVPDRQSIPPPSGEVRADKESREYRASAQTPPIVPASQVPVPHRAGRRLVRRRSPKELGVYRVRRRWVATGYWVLRPENVLAYTYSARSRGALI